MRNDISRANDALTVVNDWQLHLFKNGDAAASIFGAVGLQAISFSSLIHFNYIYELTFKWKSKFSSNLSDILPSSQATATVVAPCDGSIYECKSVAVYWEILFKIFVNFWFEWISQAFNAATVWQAINSFVFTKWQNFFLAVVQLRPFHVLLNCKLTWQ